MFSPLGRDAFLARTQDSEDLMDVLQHAGLAVLWIDNQPGGCKGVCARIPAVNTSALHDPTLCASGECHDEILLAGLDERLDRFEHVADRFGDRERTTAQQFVGQVLAFEELHHHVTNAAIERAHVHHTTDVLAANSRSGPRLAAETLFGVAQLHRLGANEFHRDALRELDVPSGHHDAHGAGADDTLDAVLACDELPLFDRQFKHQSR